MCDLGREHGGFRLTGTEPVQRPGGEELREVRAGVEVWGAGCERRCTDLGVCTACHGEPLRVSDQTREAVLSLL